MSSKKLLANSLTDNLSANVLSVVRKRNVNR